MNSDCYDQESIGGLLQSASMVSLEDADLYFKGRVGSDAWDCVIENLSDEDGETPEAQECFLKLQALIDATRRINNLRFRGCRASADQEHAFPRGTDTEVPKNIQYAVCELANELLDGVDDNLEMSEQSVLSQAFSGIKTAHDKDVAQLYVLAGIPSAIAWRYLLPYLHDPRQIRQVRV
jgi:hypothetical protein